MAASQTATARVSSEDKPASRASSTWFTLGYKDAAHQWWTSVTAPVAERNVLSMIPRIREASSQSTSSEDLTAANADDPYGPRVWRSTMVALSGKNRGLNEFSVERVGEPVDETLVMLHGYGAGLGFFYKNYEPLTRSKGWKLYALDMLGMGNSTRPPFRVHAKDPQGKITEAENWFIDALEEWRKIRNIEKFTLLGHSLGGYLAISYALKYPGRLNKLILASPAGIPEDPFAVNAEMPEPDESTMQNEFTQDQESIVNEKRNGSGPIKPARTTANASQSGSNGSGAPRRRIPPWLVWLWDANVSPFSIVRLAGPLGPRFVSGWTSRRFNHLPPAEASVLHDYSFSIFRQRGSGEYALPYILAPGAFARRPAINRIQGVGRQVFERNGQKIKETGIPVVLMYGDSDWMDVAAGYAAEEKLKQVKLNALLRGTDDEKRNESGGAKVVIVPKAGHHLYIDNADYFNKVMQKELEETRVSGLRRRS